MIELYDPARLVQRRDHSLLLALAVLTAVAALVGAQSWRVGAQLQALRGEAVARQAALATPDPAAPRAARAAALDDLQRQAERLEALSGGGNADTPGAAALTPAQWMLRLSTLAQPGLSLTRVEIDRAGTVRIEGATSDAAALDAFVQAWNRQDGPPRVQARSIQVRQDKTAAGAPLRFELRAQPGAAG